MLEKDRGVLGVDLLVLAEFVEIDGNRPNLPAGDREPAWILRQPKRAAEPPVRAWLMWQATPGTLGSSKALTQTWSFFPIKR